MISKPDNPVLCDYPNPHSNVFIMMRFRETPQHKDIGTAISSILSEYSLNLLRADLKRYEDELWTNVQSYMDASKYGIAVFEEIDERDINPNVSLELGYMFGQKKKCLLLKEKRVQKLQSDLVGYLYREFDSYNIETTVKPQVQHWLRDLGIAKRTDERMLVYVSHGGTCRCAMAKVITQQLLQQNPLGYKLRVESVAFGEPSAPGASYGARQAIREMFGKDLLEDHRTKKLNNTIFEEADLILVMDRTLLKVPKEWQEKTKLLKQFFDREGDVVDPWPDNDRGAALRYTNCAIELREILVNGIGKIVDALKPHGRINDAD